MASNLAATSNLNDTSGNSLEHRPKSDEKKDPTLQFKHLEDADVDADELGNIVYTNDEEEPKIGIRTWVTLLTMALLLLVQCLALNGPPSVLSFIGKDLHNPQTQTWISNSLVLMQAVLGPIISSASDTFQARKQILLSTCVVAFVGSAIAPGSQDIYRLIAAQCLIGVGFAAVPITFVVPSEVLPRKWRPMAQAGVYAVSSLNAIAGPLVIGALTRVNAHTGWRNYYWIQCGLWGAVTIGVYFGYQPPTRHTRLDHLSFWQKLRFLDLPGMGFLTVGLTLLLVGLNLGGNLYSWTDARTLSTMIIGVIVLIVFGLWEWRWTDHGILSHDLFRGGKDKGRTFALLLVLMFIEAILLFSFVIFYPLMTTILFEPDAFLSVARLQVYWVSFLIACPLWGWVSTKFCTIKAPIIAGYAMLAGMCIGLSTIQPGDDFRSLAFAALGGVGFGAPLILIIAGVQLATPHGLIATATAVTNSARAIGATVFTAVFAATLTSELTSKLPNYIAKAVVAAGLPASSVPDFIAALTSQNQEALTVIPGVTAGIISQGLAAFKQAYADSLRVIYIIAAPFGVLACIIALHLGDMKKLMTYRVDAPMENLQAKHNHD